MNKKILVLAIVTIFWTDAIADTSFTCVTDLVTGFYYNPDRDTWQHATFVPGERFVLNERRQDVYDVQRMDDKRSWSAICTARVDQTDDSFSCMSGTSQFHFNRDQLRFTAFRYFGYWNGSTDSTAISIGKCYPN